MATIWSEEETLKLIEIWNEDAMQAMLEGNKDSFHHIAKEMEAAGYVETGNNRGKTGRGRKDWKFFEAMDLVLGQNPATEPLVRVWKFFCVM